MARNSQNIDYHEDYYHGPAGFYFRKILRTIIEFGDLQNEKGIILDYGCGVGHLKKILKKDNVINYDIEPELTEIKDYRILQPTKIILSGVLEHIHLPEINQLLDEFYRMNRSAELLVYLPTENIISKIAMRLAGQKNAHDDHVSRYFDINKTIEKKYKLVRQKYIFARMAQISHYVPK